MRMYENLAKFAHQIFPKFYVMEGVQKDVKATVFLSFRASLIMFKPLFRCFWEQSLHVSYF